MAALLNNLQRTAEHINALNEWVGRSIAWLSLLMVLVTFTIVLLRYLFNISWIGMQESVIYFHSIVFMFGAAYTLKQDAHVRVDIVYQHLSVRGKAWVDLLGTVFLLLPVAGFIFWSSWEYVLDAWDILEGSRNSGGLPLVYLLKSCLLVMSGLLFLQGIGLILHKLVQLIEPQHG